MEYDEARRVVRRPDRRTGAAPQLLDELRSHHDQRDETLVGRAAPSGARSRCATSPRHRRTRTWQVLLRDGWRSLLAAPMLRGDRIVGRGRDPATHDRDASPPDVVELLETLASQSALAIVNARLFGELAPEVRRARGGQPAQVGVPGQHVPRAAHARSTP